MVDYAGLANQYLKTQGLDLGTVIEGTVMERDLAEDPNRVEVTVILRTKNALTWVADYPGWPDDANFNNFPLLFGWRANDVLTGAKPALAESFFNVVFKNDKGAPLPDLVELYWARFSDFVFMQFQAAAKGQFPDGTPGRATITQTVLVENYFNNPSPRSRVYFDACPAERIDLQVVGK